MEIGTGERRCGNFSAQPLRCFVPGIFMKGCRGKLGGTPPRWSSFSFAASFMQFRRACLFWKKIFFGLLFFINAFSLPFIIAFILYLVTMLLCKGMFTYNILFGIAAYASITLFFSWIPGLAGPTEILRFCLIGLGIIKVGRITILKAFACMLCTAAAMLLLIQLLRPFLGQ